jgi:H+/gluconate symporter-like permease
MPLLSVALAVALMLVLVAWAKLDAFLALLLTAFAVGIANGLGPLGTLQSILKGLGATLGGVTLILVFGAMLGALVDSSGAARVITDRLVARFGPRGVQLAMVLTGFLVGLPMLYNAGFLLLIPLVYAVAAQTGRSIVWVGIPLAAALSVTHGFLPPHPAPTFVAFAYGADVNRTLAAGLLAAVPACLLGGVAFARLLPSRILAAASATSTFPGAGSSHGDAERGEERSSPSSAPKPVLIRRRAERDGGEDVNASSSGTTEGPRDSRPSFATSILTLLVPVLLMLVASVVDVVAGTAGIDVMRADADWRTALAAQVPGRGIQSLVLAAKFVGNANVALGIALAVALFTLGRRRGRPMPALMRDLDRATGGIAMILLVIAAGGALSQVLRDGGVAGWISERATGLHWNPLLVAFGIASLLRLAVGSATVAGMTTAGLLAPTVAASGVRPELMVLATGAGSLMFSHFNDTGFWMFKEYFGLGIKETFATWSVMEVIVALAGLFAALVMQALG